MEQDKPYFELADSGDWVRMEPKELPYADSEHDWDQNWVRTHISLKGGSFTGQYDAGFMLNDFELFRQQLNALHDNLKGNALFSGIEGQLEIKITGDGLGHFETNVVASDKPGYGAELQFSMNFDQTILKDLERQLDSILKHLRS